MRPLIILPCFLRFVKSFADFSGGPRVGDGFCPVRYGFRARVIRGAAAEQKVWELKVENQQLQQKIPSMKEKLKEAQERKRLENENRQLTVAEAAIKAVESTPFFLLFDCSTKFNNIASAA